MERRAWTARGEMTAADRQVIQAMAQDNKVAARIFVTGEAHEYYLGEAAYRLLINVNDVLYKNGVSEEPLFLETKDSTVRMARFDPQFVWRCFHPEILVDLVVQEAKRLGVNMDPWKMDNFDFYEEMIACIKAEKGDFIIPKVQKGGDLTSFYHAVYLSCLLLFGKPGYMDVPVAQHFVDQSAEAHLKYAEYKKLSEKQADEVKNLRVEYGGIQGLTNPELNFIVGLYEGGK